MKRRLLTPAFLSAAAVLVAATIGLEPALAFLERHFEKEPIALLRSLDDFDVHGLPSFTWNETGGPYDTTIDYEGVGTDDAMLLVFTLDDPDAAGQRNRDAMLFVTYYDDPRSNIPHTPEVCARQAGTTVNSISTIDVPIAGTGESVSARLVEMTDHARKVVVYVLVSNGKVYHDRNHVRVAKALPFDRRFYFSKVETATHVPAEEDFEAGVERCRRLLGEALPKLMAEHLPSSEDVRR